MWEYKWVNGTDTSDRPQGDGQAGQQLKSWLCQGTNSLILIMTHICISTIIIWSCWEQRVLSPTQKAQSAVWQCGPLTGAELRGHSTAHSFSSKTKFTWMTTRWIEKERSAKRIPAPKQEYLPLVSLQGTRNPGTVAGEVQEINKKLFQNTAQGWAQGLQITRCGHYRIPHSRHQGWLSIWPWNEASAISA